jgi:streptomycin 6-kinase
VLPTEVEVPASLRWLAAEPPGRAWLARLPALVAACAERWSLAPEPRCLPSGAALLLPAVRADGLPVVLKLRYPQEGGASESWAAWEAGALAHLDGAGAVRLLAFDAGWHALVVERCVPGTPLAQEPQRALGVLARLLPRQWRPAPPAPSPPTAGAPFPLLAAEAARWAMDLPARWCARGRPFERRLLDAARRALEELAPTQGTPVLLNEDLHGDNVLRATREPWLVIDPDPLVGEREFALATPVRCPEFGHSRGQVRHRLDRLSAELGLDRERARGWAVAHAVVRAFLGDPVKPHCVDVARWLL